MTIEHADIVSANTHEPKGALTATSGHVYVADGIGSGVWTNKEPKDVPASNLNFVYHSDGAGSGNWKHANPHGGWRYGNIGLGTTYATPTAYTLLDVVGASSQLHDFTYNNAGRLTYTGAADVHYHMVMDSSFKHSTGSGQDVFFELYKNGVAANRENVATADSANYQHMAAHFDDMLSTNDYLEVYIKTASGNIIIHTAYMFLIGMPE